MKARDGYLRCPWCPHAFKQVVEMTQAEVADGGPQQTQCEFSGHGLGKQGDEFMASCGWGWLRYKLVGKRPTSGTDKPLSALPTRTGTLVPYSIGKSPEETKGPCSRVPGQLDSLQT